MNVYETLENDMSNEQPDSVLSEHYKQTNIQQWDNEQLRFQQGTIKDLLEDVKRGVNQQLLSQHLLNSVAKQSLNIRRRRTSYSRFQMCSLENEYLKHTHLNKAQIINICTRLNMSEKQVRIWFQNRRMKQRVLEQFEISGDESTSPYISDKDDHSVVNNLLTYEVDQNHTNGYNSYELQPQQIQYNYPQLYQYSTGGVPAIYSTMQHHTLMPTAEGILDQTPPASPQQYYTLQSMTQASTPSTQVELPQESLEGNNLYDDSISRPSSSSSSESGFGCVTPVEDFGFGVYPEMTFSQNDPTYMPGQSPTYNIQHISPPSPLLSFEGGSATPAQDFDFGFLPQNYVYPEGNFSQEARMDNLTYMPTSSHNIRDILSPSPSLSSDGGFGSATPEQDFVFGLLQQDHTYPEVTFNQETRIDVQGQSPTYHNVEDISPRSTPDEIRDILLSSTDIEREFFEREFGL